MVAICFYFQVHQPKRLRDYTFFDIGKNHYYEDDEANRNILLKVAHKCYLPTNHLLLQLIEKYPGRFKVSFSLTGTVIEQFKCYSPETLDSFKRLVDTGAVELINETYYHSLSFLHSRSEFKRQVILHRDLIKQEFNFEPVTFRNTELIYNNDIAQAVELLGYKTILADGVDRILGWRSPNFLYQPKSCDRLKLLLRNSQLSDDIGFRFSNKDWKEHPLTAEKFAHWVHQLNGHAQIVNLFMDYETFGEHHWEDVGIFNFLAALPEYIFKHPDFSFCTPAEASQILSLSGEIDAPYFSSWADTERDLTAWMGNELQDDALSSVYALEKVVNAVNCNDLTRTWQSLLVSDHFYYMCTKRHTDGDVHQYFSPYQNPYEAYTNFQNIISDFSLTLKERMASKIQQELPVFV